MFIRLNLLLLLLCCFISNGTASRSVSGMKGGNVILPCEYEDKNILETVLRSETENIDVCDTEECSGRVFKEGSCDIIIKDLSFSDAGTYYLRVYFTNDQTDLEPQIRTYQLHIHDEISVNTDEELKMDVLLANAEKVETNSSGEWTEVWTRGHGVSSDRLTNSDENLIINNFTSNDAGTYRVLDYEGEILITVTVTESGAESKDGLNDISDDKTDDTEQGTTTVGNILHVTGQKGENATLPCDIKARDIFRVILSRLSKNILDCQNEQCKSENRRVFKNGLCDIIIKDLIFSDAGKYILNVHYTDDKEKQTREYHLHIHGKAKTDQTIRFPLVIVLVFHLFL